MVEVQKLEIVFCVFAVPARPSAEIGVVDGFFCDVSHARANLCGNRRAQGAKTRSFWRILTCSRDPLRGSAWSRCKNSSFLRFLRFRGALRGSAWSRCKKTQGFFTISAVPARPSAGIGQGFCDFCGSRAALCGDRRGRGAET